MDDGPKNSRIAAEAARIAQAQPNRVVLSAPRPGGPYRRAILTRRGDFTWQAERLTATQAFHQNFAQDALAGVMAALLAEDFTQLTAFTETRAYSLRLTKKGKLLANDRALPSGAAGEAPGPAPGMASPAASEKATGKSKAAPKDHNRAKRRLLPEGIAIPPLVDLGVMTADGQVVAARRDKYRQINRFVELVADALDTLGLAGPGSGGSTAAPEKTAALAAAGSATQALRVIDFGCGKSYLTFVLYHYLTHTRGLNAQITGLDLKADVVAGCNAAAHKYGYAGLDFEVGDIAQYNPDTKANPLDIMITLHACDTATDHALAKAVGWGARAILSVPCCQHELNAQMHSDALAILTRYGLVKERAAALFTDALRANLLAACGYKVQLVEFVDFEHTPKNVMIRAVRASVPKAQRQKKLDEARRLCEAFDLNPCLWRLLSQNGEIEPL